MADGDITTTLAESEIIAPGQDDSELQLQDPVESEQIREISHASLDSALSAVEQVQGSLPPDMSMTTFQSVIEIPSGPSMSNVFGPTDDALSDNGSEGSSKGSSKGSLSHFLKANDDDNDNQYGDDEYSGDEMTEDQAEWMHDLDAVRLEPDENEDEMEEEEEEIDEAEEDADNEEWKRHKKLFHFSQFKKDKLMTEYMQCIENLKAARKKNLYLQDRIYKHLREKEKVLSQCHEAVRERQEKAIIQHSNDMKTKVSRTQDIDEQENICDEIIKTEEPKVKPEAFEEKSNPGELFETILTNFNQDKKRESKCKRRSKQKHGKGPSKANRLAMRHYHPEALLAKKPQIPKEVDCLSYSSHAHSRRKSKRDHVEEDLESESKGKNRIRKSLQPDEYSKSALSIYQSGKKLKSSADIDDLEDEWKYRHEKRRTQDIRRSRAAKKSLRKGGVPQDLDGLATADKKSRRGSYDNEHNSQRSGGHSENVQTHQQRKSLKRNCRERMRRQKSIMNRNLMALQKAQEITAAGDDGPGDSKDIEDMLPEFTYEFSDPSLTKMKYGDKMRKDMEKVIKATKLPIMLEWPLAVKGFNDYFKLKNPYGKVIYTMRLDSQVRQAKKMSRKYKYVLHNYNYQLQQYNVLNEVHESNMKYLEISKHKWQSLVDELFARVIQELRDYSNIAVDSTGKRIPKIQVDHLCKEVGNEFENFQYSARIFYRVLHNLGVAIRELCYSESQGEGVELYEFKHLLRTNETIGAQFNQKQDVLAGFKSRAKRLENAYEKQLIVKEDVEEAVTDKFRLSGEISCLMEPKQRAVKSFESTAKKVLKQETVLQQKAGIVPYRHLVIDYEATFLAIAEKRQVRRDNQLKYNSRVREVHSIFDKMEEIERKMPELFMDRPRDYVPTDSCGDPIISKSTRPKTAPGKLPTIPSSSSTKSSHSFTESRAKAGSLFFSKYESRHLLEQGVTSNRGISSVRPKTATPSFRAVDRKVSDPTGSLVKPRKSQSLEAQSVMGSHLEKRTSGTSSSNKSQKILSFRMEDGSGGSTETLGRRPSTAGAGETRLSDGGGHKKRPSLGSGGDRRGSVVETYRNSLYSTKIAGEQAEIAAAAKRRTMQQMRPTAAKTGIVPRITQKNMLSSNRQADKYPQRLRHNTLGRPATASISPYESETKNWPYQYYTKPSPQLEKTSKRRMDVVLGSLVHQPRRITLGSSW